MIAIRRSKTWVWMLGCLLAAACSSSGTGGDGDGTGDGDGAGTEPPAPEDDVTDEAAGEDALAVLDGEMPGVAIIVLYAEGADVDTVTEGLASQYGLTITSRYHDLGGGAFIAPDQSIADQVELDVRVLGVSQDAIVALSPGDAFDAELSADLADAEASGEAEASDADAAAPGSPVGVKRLTPQVSSTGWRLIRADRVLGDGSGTRVAVIDTGVDMFHPDLDGVVADMGKDCVRRKNKTVFDLQGHGTHVSGIIAAQNNSFGMVGVAPGARIVPVRVLNKDGRGSWSSILCGIDYVARRSDRVDVANLSLGANCGGPCAEMPHHRALRRLVGRGVTVVVAAGNDGIDADHADPAFIDEVITVSAYMDWNGQVTSRDRYAHFSNWGPGVDIGAPGVRIWSSLPDEKFARWNGTSMAAPFVAAAAAVVIGTEGGSPEEVRAALLASARTTYTGRGGDHPERLLLIPSGGGTCGDGLCIGDETDESCPRDCGCAASNCDEPTPYGCFCDDDCAEKGDCCADAEICPIM